MSAAHVLLVEDDEIVAAAIEGSLDEQRYTVTHTADGAAACACAPL